MFNSRREERDLLIRTANSLTSHIEECLKDKRDINQRLDEQDRVSNERHVENVRKLNRIQISALGSAVMVLLAALGGLVIFLLNHIALK